MCGLYGKEKSNEVGKRISQKLDDKFEELLKVYMWEELHLSEELVRQTGVIPVGFDILYFASANKSQFVSTVTKEVLFEVRLEFPKPFEEGDINLYWNEFWRYK